jgi:hypothetical protein
MKRLSKYKNTALKSLVFTCLMVVSLFGGAGEAKAVSFDFTVYGLNDYWNDGTEVDKNDNGVIETNYTWTVANFTVNTDKSEYAPGESISLAATAYSDLCDNFFPYFNISASVDYGGSVNIINDELGGRQTGTIYGSGVLTAPNNPGTYDIYVNACHFNHEDYNLNGCVEVPLTITVAGTPIPEPGAKPDLYSTTIAPIEGTVVKAGNPVRFEGTAVNTNDAVVPAGTFAGLEVDLNGDGGSIVRFDGASFDDFNQIPTDGSPLSEFALGQVYPLVYTYSNLPTGNHKYRFNVDTEDSVSESNGYNNASAWSTVKVISGTLTSSVSNVPSGGSATLTWNTVNTLGFSTCKVETTMGALVGTGTSGSVSTGPLTTETTYILSCEGITLNNPFLVIGVSGSIGTPDLSASNLLVNQGQPTTLNWNTNNGNEKLCTLAGGSIIDNPLANDEGDVNTGSEQVTVNARTTYTLTCPTGTDTVTVEVVPRAYET